MDQPNSDPPTVRPVTEPTVSDSGSRFSGAPVPAAHQPTMNDTFGQLDGYAEQLRVKLPAAPPGLIDGYMRFVPWLALIFGILGIIFSVLLLIFGAVLAPLMLFAGASGVRSE